MLFDTHTHLNDDRFRDDFDEVLKRALEAGVSRLLIASYDLKSSYEAAEIAASMKDFYCSAGIHPHDASSYSDEIHTKLRELALKNRDCIAAIGEIGLDFHYDNSPREIQKYAFLRQIELAHELDLPVIIHDREAHGDIMDIVRKAYSQGLFRERAGVFHCFSGSPEMAAEILRYGFYISFAGPVTFKNARKTSEVIAAIPMERILIETDCPYLAPEPHRGTRNEPSYVRYVAGKLAEIKGISLDKAAEMTTMNACSLFGIEYQ